MDGVDGMTTTFRVSCRLIPTIIVTTGEKFRCFSEIDRIKLDMLPNRRLVYRTVWVKKRGRLVVFGFRSFVGNVGPHRYLIPAVGLLLLKSDQSGP